MSFISDDEIRERIETEHKLVDKALVSLEMQDRHWGSNLNAWDRMDLRARYQWYERMKMQADLGLPTAIKLVAEVLAVRLRS